jgi:PAS domain S-box-containing protein
VRLGLANLLIFGAYVATAQFGLHVTAVSGFATLVWAPSGIALAGVLIAGYSVWPAIALAAFLVNQTLGAPVLASLSLAIGNTLEAILAASLLRSISFTTAMTCVRSVVFFFAAAVASTLVGATIGVSSLWSFHKVAADQFAAAWIAWWFGDMMGAFVITPLILTLSRWADLKRIFPNSLKALEGAVLGLLLFLTFGTSFFGWHLIFTRGLPMHLQFLIFPLLIWASTRFGPIGASMVSFLTFIAAVGSAIVGRGPYAQPALSEGLAQFYFFISTVSGTGLVLAAYSAELESAEAVIRARKDDLENQVQERSKELIVANEELRKQEYLLDQAQHIAKVGAWEWDIKTGKVTWSKELYTIFDIGPEYFKGTAEAFIMLLPANERDGVRFQLEKAIREKSKYFFEHSIITKSGERKTMRCRGQVLLGQNLEVVGMLGTSQDITEEKRVEQRLREAQAIAEEANQAKTHFITNMSHEIRTPLGIVLGLSELLADPDITEAERKTFLKSLRQNGLWLSELINDVLDLSKIETGQIHVEPAEVSLLEVLNEIRQLLEPRAQDVGLNLKFSFRGRLPDRFRTDPMRLRQIFMNIIGNAVKFTAAGRVEVRTLMVGHGKKRCLAFDVADTGIGMSKEQQGKLFQPFTQADPSTKRRFGGTGLGLFLSQQLAQALGGDVAIIASRHGRGTVMRITIDPGPLDTCTYSRIAELTELADETGAGRGPGPSVGARTGGVTSVAAPKPKKDLTGKSVLLVDDSIDNQKLIAKFLKSVGAEVDAATNGVQGVEKALNGKYDVVLMDIQMPLMDGIEATRKLREQGYGRPIIALTAHALSDERTKCLKSGFSDYLSKPVTKGMLIEHVTRVS